jgi:hypothetical protein
LYVPLQIRHKREIIIVQGKELNAQKNKTYKEIIEQLNEIRVAGEAVAVR